MIKPLLKVESQNGLSVHNASEKLRNGQNATNGNGNHDNGVIRTAPSYTFYATRKVLGRSGFVLHTSRDVLEYLQTWLGVAYPLAKLDFVALPSLDREMISSLGLITLQTGFLLDPDTITTEQYHMAAIKIAEAIVKQFLGGITSPKIWKHSWLWEGLIKYFGRLVLTPLQPLWPMEEMHLMHITTRAMDIDAIQGWDSILQGTSEDGKNDEFYVDKSAAILAMLHSAIGENNFRACLGAFLNSYRFETSEPMDLWTICTKKINGSRNIKEMMSLWTNLESFPLLTVTKVGSSVSISQQVFQPMEFNAILDEPYMENFTMLSSSTTTPPSTSTTTKKPKIPTKWSFPVNYITDVENVTDVLWFHNSDGKIVIWDVRWIFFFNNLVSVAVTFQLSTEIKWIKVNAGQMGYYRVLYNEDNWQNIIEELKRDHGTFSALVSQNVHSIIK